MWLPPESETDEFLLPSAGTHLYEWMVHTQIVYSKRIRELNGAVCYV